MTNKLKEYQLDPTTGAYTGEDPGYDYADIPVDTTMELPAIEIPATEVQVTGSELKAQNAFENVCVSVRDWTVVNDDNQEFALEISLAVNVVCTETNCIKESGTVTRRVRLGKASLSAELSDRNNKTPITEGVVEQVKKEAAQQLDEAARLAEEKRQAAVKRARELAGLPGRGTWV